MHDLLIYFIPTTSIPFIIPARPGRLDTPLLTIAVATRKAGHRKPSRRDEVENPSLLSASYLSRPFAFYRP
ncbi:uncharacterized protein IAS62_005268 [Cryptococcus decagattii]|uniref:Uncharacterized protein n=1 Tax=Cryptococcus decagattii TaxID=1859122 RepID=A0ABZ2B5A0_9TREE